MATLQTIPGLTSSPQSRLAFTVVHSFGRRTPAIISSSLCHDSRISQANAASPQTETKALYLQSRSRPHPFLDVVTETSHHRDPQQRSTMLELLISSEVAGLINFLACEIVIMGYIMFATSIIAGSLNNRAIQKGTKLILKVFDVPHIGGGLVMSACRSRWILIFLRFSTFVAISISNFGLEGRTRTTEFQEAIVRRPGPLRELNTATLFNATEQIMHCSHTDRSDLVFGAVINGQCYHIAETPSLSSHVYVRSLSLNFTAFNASALGCTAAPEEELNFTVFRCRDMDLSCLGIFYGGEDVKKGRCESVIYEHDESWLCPVHSARPGVLDEPVQCRRVCTYRDDIALWTNVFRYRTDDLETAVFASAYGVEERKRVALPMGNKNVTVVSLFWLIPAAYEIFVVWTVTIWAITLKVRGAKIIGNDERGLARLLTRKLDTAMFETGEGLGTDVHEPLQILHRPQPYEEYP